jgi:hypothetical protein
LAFEVNFFDCKKDTAAKALILHNARCRLDKRCRRDGCTYGIPEGLERSYRIRGRRSLLEEVKRIYWGRNLEFAFSCGVGTFETSG